MSAPVESVVPYPALLEPNGMNLSYAESAAFQTSKHLHAAYLAVGKTLYFIPASIGIVFEKEGRLERAAQQLRLVLQLSAS